MNISLSEELEADQSRRAGGCILFGTLGWFLDASDLFTDALET
jgi:hypothetical protein